MRISFYPCTKWIWITFCPHGMRYRQLNVRYNLDIQSGWKSDLSEVAPKAGDVPLVLVN
jgi:hypothetical protein